MSFDAADFPHSTTKRYKFIGCEIMYREACYLAATGENQVDVEFLLKGLHDLPTENMLEKLQATVDAVDTEIGYEAILLGYARCNNGLVGLTARDIPMVIPRAHDCIALFFGGRKTYNDYFAKHPGTYFTSSGWLERDFSDAKPAYGMDGVLAKLGLADSYETMVEKYGKEGADFIVESVGGWQENYSHGLYLEMGVCDETPLIEIARKMAQDNDWEFEVRKGDMTLLENLFSGEWGDDFLIIPPGATIEERNDDSVLGLAPQTDAPCQGKSCDGC